MWNEMPKSGSKRKRNKEIKTKKIRTKKENEKKRTNSPVCETEMPKKVNIYGL